MSILVDKNTRLLVQGITGKAGGFHAKQCAEYGTNVVAGGDAGPRAARRGRARSPFSILRTKRAKKRACNATMIFVPAPGAADAILEAADAGIELIVCITEGIPVIDMMRAKVGPARQEGAAHRPELSRHHHAPASARSASCPATSTSPAKSASFRASGTLTYEAVWQLTSRGLGQSTCIGIGGDPINGTSHTDAVRMFNEDPDTEAIILIGEIGGTGEEDAAAYIKEHVKKPVAAFIARGYGASRTPHGPRRRHRLRRQRNGCR